MADAHPPIRYGRLVHLAGLLKFGRIEVKTASQWLQKHSLLLLAFGASTLYRTWLTTPLNGLLRWIGGIYCYYQAYWLVNIYTFKDIQKCNSILENVKGWEPGYDFWEMRNDQWWLYMSCLGNDAGWSKRLWDNVDAIYESINRVSDIFMPDWRTDQRVLAYTVPINVVFVGLYGLIVREGLSEWMWYPTILATNAFINHLIYGTLLIYLGHIVPGLLPLAVWHGFQFGVPAFLIFYRLEWIPIRVASMIFVRQRTLAAAGRNLEDIQNQQDEEEVALIMWWRGAFFRRVRLEIAIMIVRYSTTLNSLPNACRSLWAFCKSGWGLRKRVADLEQRLSNAIEGRNGWRRKFLQMLRFRNECIALHHHFEVQTERRVSYDELVAKFNALRQASSALILAGGPARATEKLIGVAIHTRDLHRKQIQTLVSSFIEAGAEMAILKDKVKTLEEDLKAVNSGRATMLWRETVQENLELRRQAQEEILERDVTIKRLRDNRDESAVTSLSLDSTGQQILRKLQERLISAEINLAHAEMIVEKSKFDRVKHEEEIEQIKKDALYGESERLGELYTDAVIQAVELTEELKRFEFSTDPEHDIEAVQSHCNQEKEKLQREIATKNLQISTFKAQIDHAIGSMNWADDRFQPLDKYFGFIPGAKGEIRRLSAALEKVHFQNIVPQAPARVDQMRYLKNLTTNRNRLLDERQSLRVILAELSQNKTQSETELARLRDRVARRNTQVTNLKTRNRELQLQLREAEAAAPPVEEALNISGIAAPVVVVYARNLIALRREMRKRGREVSDLPDIPGANGIPRVEGEPIEISQLRVFNELKDMFQDLSRSVRESDPPWLGATDDWVDDNTDSPENMNARRLNRILKLKDLWDYIGTLHYDTILFVREICQKFGIEHGVELPERPQSPSPLPSPTPSPPPPRSRDRDLFPALFTQYEVFDIERWNVFPHDQENVTPAFSVKAALQRSIQEQLPDHDANNLEPIEFERHLANTLGRNINFLIDPIHERDVAEVLYKISNSFVLKTVTQFPRWNGGFRYLSREILYPDTLEVTPPRTVVVLYLSDNIWQGMSLKPTESDHESDSGSDVQAPPPEPRLPALMEFDLTDWKLNYAVRRWTIPGQAVLREGLTSISAVANSLHWQYPGILWNEIRANEAYEALFAKFQRVHPHHEEDYFAEHIQVVLDGILRNGGNRPHYRLAAITSHEVAAGDNKFFVSIYGGDSESPLLYVAYQPRIGWMGMRKRRAGDSDGFLGDLEWGVSVQQLQAEEIQAEELPAERLPVGSLPIDPIVIDDPVEAASILPAVILPRIENYGRNSIKAPFDRAGWTFDVDLEHFNEGLRRGVNREPWIHNCAQRALYYSIRHQHPNYLRGNLTPQSVMQAFDDVFPRHGDSWKDEEVARILRGYPTLGGYELAIVNCMACNDDTMLTLSWSQPEGYNPASDNLLFVGSVLDRRIGFCQGEDVRHHWMGMKYRDGEAVPNPRLFRPQPAVPPSRPPKSKFVSLLNAATSSQGPKKTPVSQSSASSWSNFDTSKSFVSQSGKKWVPPSTPPTNLPITMIPSVQTGKQFGTVVQKPSQPPPPNFKSASSSFKLQYWPPLSMATQQQQQRPGLNPHTLAVPFGELFVHPAPLQQQPPQPQRQPQGQNTQGQVGLSMNIASRNEQMELARKLQAEQSRGGKHSKKDKESKRVHGMDKETGMGRGKKGGRGKGRGRGRGRGRGEDGGNRQKEDDSGAGGGGGGSSGAAGNDWEDEI
ncbi:uncharacterized protein EAE97_006737 [Botrytis byssoidea]|uniref:Uncharacterized protein n=1 Tax=Botrytis byssoidea TaxID=139641 RepID=A0A9P5II89_9HELO|nr:uncharacterized protein EAE97_006737 [Botrytis byssoidea]KAF7941900.1 hypothetical protein EAE97_006737 [Botrytis byssoidea]